MMTGKAAGTAKGSPLRQRMIDQMRIANLAESTQIAYLFEIERLAKHYGTSPADLDGEQLRDWILKLIDRGLSPSSTNSTLAAFRFFYVETLGCPERVAGLRNRKKPQALPRHMTEQEVERLILATPDLRHRAAFIAAYGAGLRVSETVNVKIADIKADRKCLHIPSGKGGTERMAPLANGVIHYLRGYYKNIWPQPATWLFYGASPDEPMRTQALHFAFKKARDKVGIDPRHTFHSLRHSTATHLLERGADIEVTLRTIAADPRHGGMRIGGTAVLHTWDQKLRFHPHVHVVVPNAGFDVESGEWKTGSGAWLAPVKVLSSFFRRRFLEDLARAHGRGELGFHGTAAHLANPGEFHATLAAARSRDWVVYAKRPFKGPEQVFSYLARYTHRIAISDSRITAFDGERVSFRHRKPKTPGQRKPRYGTITVSAEEFIRRFLLHVLPDGMHRIRYFGILANGCRARTLERAREALGSVGCATPGKTAEGLEAGHDRDREREPEVTTAPVACSHCGGVLRLIREIPRRQEPLSTRGPPDVPPPRGAGP